MQEQGVGLDSHCVSYLLDAITGIEEPTDTLAEERKALVRIWYYRPGTFYLSETVVFECARIRQEDRRELHQRFVASSFLDLPVRDCAAVEARATCFRQFHPKLNDCRVLAEAEDLGLNTLLTYDRDFKQRLGPASPLVALTTPSAYWIRLGIPKGTRPQNVPHDTSPLSQQAWWRWDLTPARTDVP